MSDPITTAGRYVQYAELRRIALEMALDRFRNVAGDDDVLFAAEKFFEFLIAGSGRRDG